MFSLTIRHRESGQEGGVQLKPLQKKVRSHGLNPEQAEVAVYGIMERIDWQAEDIRSQVEQTLNDLGFEVLPE